MEEDGARQGTINEINDNRTNISSAATHDSLQGQGRLLLFCMHPSN